MKLECVFILIFTLFINTVYAQTIHLQGSIIDNKTDLTIAGATISIAGKKLFYMADKKGQFNIANNKIVATDSLTFSCVGYQTDKVIVNDIAKNGRIELVPIVNTLNEVKVNTNRVALIKVGSKKKTGYEHWLTHPDINMAMYMEGSKNVKGTIKSVGFFLTRGHGMFKGGNVAAPFNIKLYGVDTNGMPGKELTADSIIVSAKKEWAWFDVDISGYHIQNPDSGFFVSYNLLDYTHYKRITKIDNNVILLSGGHGDFLVPLPMKDSGNAEFNTPRLCVTNKEFKVSRSYFLTYNAEDYRLHWLKFYLNQSYMIRAAIAPE